jgi:hypothetical protein
MLLLFSCAPLLSFRVAVPTVHLSMLAGALNLRPLFLRISTLLPRKRIFGSWRSPLAPYSVYPVFTPEPCNEYGVLRKTRARLQLREYQVHLDATL